MTPPRSGPTGGSDGTSSEDLVLTFDRISAADVARVGGKGANLGELTRAGFQVPPGFCLTTAAFERFVGRTGTDALPLAPALESLRTITGDDLEAVRRAGSRVREELHALPMPPTVITALLAAWRALGPEHAYAVRSSATAEDLPDASFAGQQDTYLNVRGEAALVEAVKNCWISLFADRAISYRAEHGFGHHDVLLSVVVQRMVEPEVSGILFTADPVSGNRDVVSIDASFGLGEALVSGQVSADLYRISKQHGGVLERRVANKEMLIRASSDGGIETVSVAGVDRQRPALSDDQAQRLARLGVAIEAHFGSPQDIEWALRSGTNGSPGTTDMPAPELYVLQARPITSLFPLPQPALTVSGLRAYMSFGHVQAMTDPASEMGRSLWSALVPFGRPEGANSNPYVASAAGRTYFDVSAMLRHPIGNRILLRLTSVADPAMSGALRSLSKRPDFRDGGGRMRWAEVVRWVLPLARKLVANLLFLPPEGASRRLLDGITAYTLSSASVIAQAKPGAARLLAAQGILTEAFEAQALPLPSYFATAAAARALLHRMLPAPQHEADLAAVARGITGNVTTDMDLAVGDVADAARGSPELVTILERPDTDANNLPSRLSGVPASAAFLAAWRDFLARYGMRGPAEIDIARPRWSDDATSLLQMVVGNLSHGAAGAHRERHAELQRENEAAAARLLEAACAGPLGWLRASLARRLLRVSRNLSAVRDHPKFLIVKLLALLKPVIIAEGEQLAHSGRLNEASDVWQLSWPELIAAVDAPSLELRHLVAERQAARARYRLMRPPRVMTSRGEIVTNSPVASRVPEGGLAGTAVSAGVVEGIAHVVLDPRLETLLPGEILVAAFTDPGWTPLFIQAGGLVTEIGGLMTHGSVVAREYGIPAVVGVADATTRIVTGQRIRVDGTLGLVQRLDADGRFTDVSANARTSP